MTTNVTELLVDSLKQNDLWTSYTEVLQAVYDKKLGSPLKEFAKLKNISHDTDPVFVERTIREAGLELNSEFFELNRERLTKSFYELIRFWEVDGNPDYPKFISFLLGRSFSESVLYTSDESELGPTHGKLVNEGGDWYATSHVDITVDARELESQLELRVVSEDIEYIRKKFGYNLLDSQARSNVDTLINNAMNRVLDPKTDNGSLVRAIIESRILKVYYQFAPIEKVVRDVLMSIPSEMQLSVYMSSTRFKNVYIDSSEAQIASKWFVIPSMVQGFRKYPAQVLLALTDDTEVSEFPQKVEGSYIKSFDGISIEFEDIDFIEDISFEYEIRGQRQTVNVRLFPIGTPFIPDELQIVSTNRPQEGRNNVFKLVTRHDNMREYADSDRVSWHIDSEHAYFNDNVLVVSEIFEEYGATVTVEHFNVDGTTSTKTKPVTLVPSAKERTAKGIRVILEQDQQGTWVELDPKKDIVQGMLGVYATAIVEYSDGTEQELYSLPAQQRAGSDDLPLVEWNVSSSASDINEMGMVDIPIVYRDFGVEYTAIYQDKDRLVKGSVLAKFKKPRLVIDSIEIIGPQTVIEETRTVYQLQATWSNGMQSMVKADWSSSQTADATSAEIENGLLEAPTVDKDNELVNINASVSAYRYDEDDNESVVRLAVSKKVNVISQRREIVSLETICPHSLNQGNTNRVKFYADWNDGTNTQLVPYRIELIYNQETISKYIRSDSETFEHKARNPVILGLGQEEFDAPDDSLTHQQFVIDYLTQEPDSLIESISGLVDIKMWYVNPLDIPPEGIVLDDETLENTDVPLSAYTTTFSVAPKIYLSEDLEIVAPEVMGEARRCFLTALVTYANGEIEQANAVWTVEPTFVDQDIEADLTQGHFTIERMMFALIGVDREWLDSNQLTADQVTKLVEGEIMFKAISEQEVLDWSEAIRNLIDTNVDQEFPRALIQTRNLEDGQEQTFKVNARYFQQDETVTITNVADPVQVYDVILSSRIEGPGLIYADNTLDYSYGLVVDYEDLGESYMVSNDWRIEVANKSEVLSSLLAGNSSYKSLLPTKADLSLYEVSELDDDQLEEIFTNISVAEIDNEGYVYPRININAELVIHADFDDGITEFTKSMEVYMKSTNTVLTGMYVYNITNDGNFERNSNVTPTDSSGSDEVIKLDDIPILAGNPDSFAQVEPSSGKLFYRFKAKVERTDELGTFYDPSVVEWSLETASNKVSLMQPDRNIIGLLVDPVETDVQVILRGTYTEEFERQDNPTTAAEAQDRVETVASSIRVIIESSKAIDSIERQGVDYVYDDADSVFVPVVRIRRRDGSYVADPSSMVTWYIESGPSGLAYDQEAGGYRIPQLTQNTVMILKAVAKEGMQTISESFEYSLIMQFVPSSIDLVLPQTVQTALIDSGEYQLGATLIGNTQDGQENRDATDDCFYYFNYNEDDAYFDDNLLSVSPVFDDKNIVVSIKSKSYPEFVQERGIKVYSSFPLFGSYFEGVDSSADFNQYLSNFNKLASRTGGSFTLDPNSDQFGYFAHPKSLGLAQFTYIPESNSSQSLFGGWDGVQRDREGNGESEGPIEVTRVYEDGLEEIWYLYRTNFRGFSQGKFAVRYVQE